MVLMNVSMDLTSYQVEKPLVKHFLYLFVVFISSQYIYYCSDATMFNMIDSSFFRLIKHIVLLKHIGLAHQLW